MTLLVLDLDSDEIRGDTKNARGLEIWIGNTSYHLQRL